MNTTSAIRHRAAIPAAAFAIHFYPLFAPAQTAAECRVI
jgi:hypothetical protein